ncbi:MAG: sigma-54 dependent transcriptional regulator [Thermodesulfobacteriota bacterium]
MQTILVISADPQLQTAFDPCFPAARHLGRAASVPAGLEAMRDSHPDVVFLDLRLLEGGGRRNGYRAALQPIWAASPHTEVIVMAGHDMVREAVMAVKAGASNYVLYPLDPHEVRYVTESVQDSILMQSELDYLRDQFWRADSLEIVQTRCPAMKRVFDKVRSVAPTRSTVLLSGETGTGKGVLARLIHKHSDRREAQFISIHCGAIPDTLLESELFGHEKGAFTGAIRRKLGKFEIAKEGTIFLDEIATITPAAQIKLLQILQDGTFQRLGGEETLAANVRVIAATNVDLKAMGEAGQFRRDLYYRLNVFPIEIPPLRERREDIALLAAGFLKRQYRFNQKPIQDIHPAAMAGLLSYAWPGNIRELENVIERASILEASSMLMPESFPAEIFGPQATRPRLHVDASRTLAEVRQAGVAEIERCYLRELLAVHEGSIKKSAATAGITSRQLHKLMSRHGLHKEAFKAPAAPAAGRAGGRS